MHSVHHRKIDGHLDRIEDYLRGMVQPPRARYDPPLLDQVLRLAFLPVSSSDIGDPSYHTANQQGGLRVSVVYDAALSSAGRFSTVTSTFATPPPMRNSAAVRAATAPCTAPAQPLPPPPPATSPALFTAAQPPVSSSTKPQRAPAKAAPPRAAALLSARMKRPFFLSQQGTTSLRRLDCSNSNSSSSSGAASVSNSAAGSSPLFPALRPPPPLSSLLQGAAVAHEQSASVATQRRIFGSRSPSPLTSSLDKSRSRSMGSILHGREERLRPPPQLLQSKQQQDIDRLPISSSLRCDRRGAHPTPPAQSGSAHLLHHKNDDVGTHKGPEDISRHIATATSSAPEEQLSSLLSSLGGSPTSYDTPFCRRLRHLDRLLDGAAHDDSTSAPQSWSRHDGVCPSRGTRCHTEQRATPYPDLPATVASSTERQLLPASGRSAADTWPMPATTQIAHISSERVQNVPDERLHPPHPYPARLERAAGADVAAPPRLGAATGADAPTAAPRGREEGAAHGSSSSDVSLIDVDASRKCKGRGASALAEGLHGSERDRGVDRSSATVSQDAEGDVSAASNAFRETGRRDSPALISQQQPQRQMSVGSKSSELDRLPLVRTEGDLFVTSCCGTGCVKSEMVVSGGRCLATLLWPRRQNGQVAEKLRSLRRREHQHRQSVLKREVEGRYAIRLLEASDAADFGPDWPRVGDDDTATATSFTLSCSPSWFLGQLPRRVEDGRRSASSESRTNEHLADEAAAAEVSRHKSRSRSGRTLVSSRSSTTVVDDAKQQRDVQRAHLVGRGARASVPPLEMVEEAAALVKDGGGAPPSTAIRPSSSKWKGAPSGSIETAVGTSAEKAMHEAAPARQGVNDTTLNPDTADASTPCRLPSAEEQSSPPSHLWNLDKGESEGDSREGEDAWAAMEGDKRRRSNEACADSAHANDGSSAAAHSTAAGGSDFCAKDAAAVAASADNGSHAASPPRDDERPTSSIRTASSSSADFMVWRNAALAYLSPSASTGVCTTGTEAATDDVGHSDASATTRLESARVSVAAAADDAAEHLPVAGAGMAHAQAGASAAFLVNAEEYEGSDAPAVSSRCSAAGENYRGGSAPSLETLERVKMPGVREKDGAVDQLNDDDNADPRPSQLTPQPAELSPLSHAAARASIDVSVPASEAAKAMATGPSVTTTTPLSNEGGAQHSTASRSPEPASVAPPHRLDEEQLQSHQYARTRSSSVATSGSFFYSLPSQGAVRTTSSHETPEQHRRQISTTGEINSPIPRRTGAAPAPHAARQFRWQQPRTDRDTRPMSAGTSFPVEAWRCGHSPDDDGGALPDDDGQGRSMRSDIRHWASGSRDLVGGAARHSTAATATPKQPAVAWTIPLDWADSWSERHCRDNAAANAASGASGVSSVAFPAAPHRDARTAASTPHHHRKTQSGAQRRRLPPHLRPHRPWARLLTRGLRTVYYSTSSSGSTGSSEKRDGEARAQVLKHATGPGGEAGADADVRDDSFDSLLPSSTPPLAATLSAVPRRCGPWYAAPARLIKKEHHAALVGLAKAASWQSRRSVRSDRAAQYAKKGRCGEAGARGEAGCESMDTQRDSASSTVTAARSAAVRSKVPKITTHATSESRWPAGLTVSPSSARTRKLQRTATAPTYSTAEAARTILEKLQRPRQKGHPAGPTYVQLHEKTCFLRRSASAKVWRPSPSTGAITEGSVRARQAIFIRKAEGARGGGAVSPRNAVVWRLTGAPRPRCTEERCAAQQQEEWESLLLWTPHAAVAPRSPAHSNHSLRRLSAADLCGGVRRNVSSAPTGVERQVEDAAESARTSGVAGAPSLSTVATAPCHAPAVASVETAEQGLDDDTKGASAASSNAAVAPAVAEASGRDAGVDYASWAAMATATRETSCTRAVTADGKSNASTPSRIIPVQAPSPVGESDRNSERLDVRDQATPAAHPSKRTLGISSLMSGGFSEAPKDSSRSNLPVGSSGLHPLRPSPRLTSNFSSAAAAAPGDENGMQGQGETGQGGESDRESLSGTNSDADLGRALCLSAPTSPPPPQPPQQPHGVSLQRTLTGVTPTAPSTVVDAGYHHAAKTTQERVPALPGGTPEHSPQTKPLSPSPRALGLSQAALSKAGDLHAAKLVDSHARGDAAAQRLLHQSLAEPPRATQALTRTECGNVFVAAPVSRAEMSDTAVGSADACPPGTAANPCSSGGAIAQSQDVVQQTDWAETTVNQENLSRPNAEAASPSIFPAPLVARVAHVRHSASSPPSPSSPVKASPAAATAAKRVSAAVVVSPAVRHAAAPAPAMSVDMHQQAGTPGKHQRSYLCFANETPAPLPQLAQRTPQPTPAAARTARPAESRSAATGATIDSHRVTPPPPEQQQQQREALEHRIAQLETTLLLRQQTEQRHFRDVNSGEAEEAPADYFEAALDGDEDVLWSATVRDIELRSCHRRFSGRQKRGRRGGADGVGGRGTAVFDETGRDASTRAQESVQSVPARAPAIHRAAPSRVSGGTRSTGAVLRRGGLRSSTPAALRGEHGNQSRAPAFAPMPEVISAAPAPGASSVSYTQLADCRYGSAAMPAVATLAEPRYTRTTASFLIGADWRYQRIYVDRVYFPKAAADSASQGAEAANDVHEDASGRLDVARSAPESPVNEESKPAAPAAAIWCASSPNNRSADVFACRPLH